MKEVNGTWKSHCQITKKTRWKNISSNFEIYLYEVLSSHYILKNIAHNYVDFFLYEYDIKPNINGVKFSPLDFLV